MKKKENKGLLLLCLCGWAFGDHSDLHIFAFFSYAGVGCANASLGTSTMHDPLRCLAEVVRHDSQWTHRFCWIFRWMRSIEPWTPRRDSSAIKKLFLLCLPLLCWQVYVFGLAVSGDWGWFSRNFPGHRLWLSNTRHDIGFRLLASWFV